MQTQVRSANLLLDTDERKMALRRARKVSGTFEKRAPGPGCSKSDNAKPGFKVNWSNSYSSAISTWVRLKNKLRSRTRQNNACRKNFDLKTFLTEVLIFLV